MANSFKLIIVVGGTFVASAFILFLLSNGLATWSQTTIESRKITFGLWRICEFTGDDNEIPCSDILCPSENLNSSTCAKIRAAGAFIAITCAFSGICGLLCIVYCAMSGDKKLQKLILTQKILAVASLVTGMIGVSLGIAGTMGISNVPNLEIGDSAIIAIAAFVGNLIGAVTLVLAKPYF
ncbi:unnamed protein product [Adineta ricciae]|uniref:Claudin n=1 Tax=Adineta ricciae TaxID=249248 RepID=A0A815N558_ADIRI|nr:unnamed protein product [Adineta ricciae]